ncbi:MAG TPA: DUF4200 domain-containing protein [Methylomirabilota bacterium]|jgi:hypothetical protein|nr:DUF4200 domain-containing protein [Methylomirabilota bacterium]
MRKLIAVGMTVVLAALAWPAWAQQPEADAVRRELEQMRKNFEAMRQEYQKQMDAMAERLRRLEAQPAPVAAPPATPGAVAQTPPPGTGLSPSTPSAMDLLSPRQPFGLYGTRGSGQLLFDMGIAGDFIGNLVQRNVDKAGAGTFRGRENRFFPREVELSLFGQIDPYARGEVRIEMGEETRGQETGVSLAEAHLTLLTLPFNTQLKLGQMRNRYGWSNQIHEHDLPWPDRPGVYRAYFGEEGLSEKGAELTWVAPLPFYLEALVGAFNGDNETAFGRGRIKEPMITGRLRTFFELGDEHALQLSASVAHGLDTERLRHTLPGVDFRYKYRPEGWLHPLLTVGGEAIWSIRRRLVTRDFVVPGAVIAPGELIDTDGDGIPDTPGPDILEPDTILTVGNHRTVTRFGYYLYAELQPFRRWAFGARYDYVEQLIQGREKAIEPYVSFYPSEFLRFRLGYKLTDRSSDVGFSANEAAARKANELFFQASFILGAHPAHPF